MIYDFAVGRTNPATFPLEAFQRAAARAIARDYPHYTNYPGELGHEGLRTLMAKRESEREGVPVTAERISLTNGSMQAVTLVAEALIEHRDDIVITEEFTYPGTISTYRDSASGWSDCLSTPTECDPMRWNARSRNSRATTRRRASSIPKRLIRTRPARRFRAQGGSKYWRSRNASV